MTNNKILILGKGFIGERLQGAFGCPVSGRMISTFRDADEEVERYRPKILLNCIGFTGGKNVDGCELDKDTTLFANVVVPLILAEVALRRKIKLVHISSGCIYHYDYSKDKPISEDKLPDFFDLYYSRTKIYSERALEILAQRYGVLLARIRIPLDNRPHSRNILTKLINFKKVIDIPNSVTYLPDFFKALKHLLKIDANGIYNIVNKGGLRYPQLMEVYKKYVPGFKYEVIDVKKLNMVRTNLVMSTSKLERSGFKIRPIKEVIEECVQNYIKF
jgi:3,5-epimerase/4-reductase